MTSAASCQQHTNTLSMCLDQTQSSTTCCCQQAKASLIGERRDKAPHGTVTLIWWLLLPLTATAEDETTHKGNARNADAGCDNDDDEKGARKAVPRAKPIQCQSNTHSSAPLQICTLTATTKQNTNSNIVANSYNEPINTPAIQTHQTNHAQQPRITQKTHTRRPTQTSQSYPTDTLVGTTMRTDAVKLLNVLCESDVYRTYRCEPDDVYLSPATTPRDNTQQSRRQNHCTTHTHPSHCRQ